MEHINLAPTNDAPIAAFELHLLVPFGICQAGASPECDAGKIENFRDALNKSRVWEDAKLPSQADYFRESNYLHPFVNRFWRDKEIVNRWQRNDVEKLQVQVRESDDPVTYDIVHCTLMRIEPDIGLLHLALRYPTEVSKDTPLTWERMLYQINAVRRLYPPYVGATDHAHFPCNVKLLGKVDMAPVSLIHEGSFSAVDMRYATGLGIAKGGLPRHHLAPHWETLLSPMQLQPLASVDHDAACPAWHYRMLGDERAVVLTRISMAHTADLGRIDRGNWARLCFTDKPGTDKLPYSRGSLADFEALHCYDRWWYNHRDSTNTPSRILNSGFAFHWVGSAEDSDFFHEPNAGAPKVFETCYLPMAVIAVAQKTALLIASDRLAQHGVASSPSGAPPISLADQRQFVETFYAHFVRFTQRLWHDEVTPQIQGMELFDQWRKHLRLQPLYDEVRQELQDMKAWVDQRQSGRLSEEVAWLTKIAMVIGGLTLLFSILALWVAVFGLGKDTSLWLPEASGNIPFSPALTALVVVLIVATSSAAAWVVALLARRPANRD